MTKNNKILISIVIPCFNEQEVVLESFKSINDYKDTLIQKDKIHKNSFIVFVDDGSRDKTWDLLRDIESNNDKVSIIKLSRNFGHQNALLAGLMYSDGKVDCAISIDADLQQDHLIIEKMVDRYAKGVELVYAVRRKRVGESYLKKAFSRFYYKFIKAMGVDIVQNHADFRLHGKKSLNTLAKYKERQLFLRGVFPSMGFSSEIVEFDQSERHLGNSKYTFKKMMLLALDGITSFTTVPLRMIFVIGVVVLIISIAMSIKVLMNWYFDDVVAGWTELMLSIYFLGAIQLISIGFIGEYVAKIHSEAKGRPRYVIDKVKGDF